MDCPADARASAAVPDLVEPRDFPRLVLLQQNRWPQRGRERYRARFGRELRTGR